LETIMPIIRSTDAITHDVHGASFAVYAHPASGARQLAAWVTTLPAGTVGVTHTISHEEVFRVLSGRVRISIDGEHADLDPGDVAVAPPGATLGVETPAGEAATMWVATSIGLRATMPDGSEFVPPWAN
jgi:mannose-6-phosphate isomerase-like protein (cupin superfamily)